VVLRGSCGQLLWRPSPNLEASAWHSPEGSRDPAPPMALGRGFVFGGQPLRFQTRGTSRRQLVSVRAWGSARGTNRLEPSCPRPSTRNPGRLQARRGARLSAHQWKQIMRYRRRPRKTTRERMSEWVLHCAVNQRHVRRSQPTREAALKDACSQLLEGHAVNRIVGPNETITAERVKDWCAKHRSSPKT
jgi:hypothetical protein